VTGSALRVRLDDGWETARRWIKPLYQTPAIRLAGIRRRRLRDMVFVGVTGSCGKTMAKDMCAAVLGSRFPGCASRDSNNALYSVACTILGAPRGGRFCVQELGAGGPETLDQQINLLAPSVGVVISVGTDHYSAFRSAEAVAAEKGKLVAALPTGGTAVLNADDPRVLAMRERCAGRVMTFGLSEHVDVRASEVSATWPERLSFTVTSGADSARVRTRLCGAHWTPSVLAALAVGRVMGVPLTEAARSVELVDPFRGRMRPIEAGGVTFIEDDWKASFWSIPFALEFLASARAARKIVVLGTLSDYPGSPSKRYSEVASRALDAADHVVFVGPNANRCLRARRHLRGENLRVFATVREAHAFLEGFLRPGDLVLLKGSLTADHLGRLALARTRGVACWRARCGRKVFCEGCRLRTIPALPGDESRG
jgi:UDP-N-acetylmuramyl pentapeptide synthase